MVYEDGLIYALDEEELLAIDAANGDVRWRHPAPGGTLLRLDDHVAMSSTTPAIYV